MDVTEKDGTQSPVMLPALTEQIKQGDLIPLTRFDDDKRQKIAKIESTVSLRDVTTIDSFAFAPQKRINDFLDGLLKGIKAGDVAEAGEMIAELSSAVKRVDLNAMRQHAEGRKGLVERIPLVGKLVDHAKHFQAMQTGIVEHMGKIETKAWTYMNNIKAGTSNLDRLLDETEINLRELELWLVGGQQALLRMRAEFQDERERAMGSQDPVQLNRLRDMAEQINAFETRLVRLNMAFTEGLLSVPQIRTAQVAGRIEFQNTMDTVLADIPAIKRIIIQIATVRQIAKATDASEARRALHRELGTVAAGMLDTAYTRAKESQGNMEADVNHLATLTTATLATIEKGARIDETNRTKREAAVNQLGEVRKRLIEGLQSHARQSVQA